MKIFSRTKIAQNFRSNTFLAGKQFLEKLTRGFPLESAKHTSFECGRFCNRPRVHLLPRSVLGVFLSGLGVVKRFSRNMTVGAVSGRGGRRHAVTSWKEPRCNILFFASGKSCSNVPTGGKCHRRFHEQELNSPLRGARGRGSHTGASWPFVNFFTFSFPRTRPRPTPPLPRSVGAVGLLRSMAGHAGVSC